MLEDDTKTISSLDDLVNDSLLKEREATFSISFSTKKNKDRSAGLVVRVVKPVPQVERLVTMRLVPCLIMEEVDWHGNVVLGVQQRMVRVFTFREAASRPCSLHLRFCQIQVLTCRRYLSRADASCPLSTEKAPFGCERILCILQQKLQHWTRYKVGR